MARTLLIPTPVNRTGRHMSLGMPDDDNRYKTIVNMANGAYALDNTVPGDLRAHKVTVTQTKAGAVDTLGTITVVGTDRLGVAQTEVITPLDNAVATSDAYFLTIVSCTQAGWVIDNGDNDQVEIGFGPALGAPVAGTSGGHEFYNSGRIVLLIDNVTDITTGDNRTVSIVTPHQVIGLALEELVVTIMKGQSLVLGPFPTNVFNQIDGMVDIDFPAGGNEADLEVRALSI